MIGFWGRRDFVTADLLKYFWFDIGSSGILNSMRSSCFLKTSNPTPMEIILMF